MHSRIYEMHLLALSNAACLSVCMFQGVSHWVDLREIW